MSIAEEMGVTLKKTAYSEMVREANDFSCALFDREGNMIAQTDYIGSPGHLGSVRDAVKIMLREYPAEALLPGDSLITNDPYLVAGHLPDIAITTPLFHEEKLAGICPKHYSPHRHWGKGRRRSPRGFKTDLRGRRADSDLEILQSGNAEPRSHPVHRKQRSRAVQGNR